MRRFALCLLVLGLSIIGCSSSDTGVDLEWPPDATVYFDEYRVFNADCATDEDCAMALGYYHAFDRFVQMDIRRRFTTGRLADILPKALAGIFADDFADLRATFSTREGVPTEEFLYEQATPKTKAMLDAYAAGVNKWIEDMKNGDNGATFPRELTHEVLEYSRSVGPAAPRGVGDSAARLGSSVSGSRRRAEAFGSADARPPVASRAAQHSSGHSPTERETPANRWPSVVDSGVRCDR
jgi:hypothetical protein